MFPTQPPPAGPPPGRRGGVYYESHPPQTYPPRRTVGSLYSDPRLRAALNTPPVAPQRAPTNRTVGRGQLPSLTQLDRLDNLRGQDNQPPIWVIHLPPGLVAFAFAATLLSLGEVMTVAFVAGGVLSSELLLALALATWLCCLPVAFALYLLRRKQFRAVW